MTDLLAIPFTALYALALISWAYEVTHPRADMWVDLGRWRARKFKARRRFK